jgi:pimeloyl-ACP methyl ester carboxylesterase
MTETLLFIPFGIESLFGVLTTPANGGQTLVVVCGPGGPTASSFQRNGIATRLARGLGAAGFSVIRFDYHGIGDSTGEIKRFDLEKPFLGDVNAVLDWARAAGFSEIALIGLCFGTRTALSVMDNGERVAAMALVTMPLVDVMEVLARRLGPATMLGRILHPATWKGLLNPSRRATYAKMMRSLWRRITRQRPDRSSRRRPSALSRLEAAMSLNVPVLMLYGAQDKHYLNALSALESIRQRMPALELDATFPGELHGFPTVTGQDVFVEKVIAWLSATMDRRTAQPVGMTAQGGV